MCGLLGEGIINGVWLYGAEKWDTILASLDALPPVINALGIGNVRYLNVSHTFGHYSNTLECVR